MTIAIVATAVVAGVAVRIYIEHRRNNRYAKTLSEIDVRNLQRPMPTISVHEYAPSDNGHTKKNATH